MTRVIACMSGKGGVGKTSSAINIGAVLHKIGKDVVVIDGNLTTPNIGVYLGVPVVDVSLHDILKHKRDLRDGIHLHTTGLKVIPASISIDDLGRVDLSNLKKKLQELEEEIVILDSAAGLGKEAIEVIEACDEILIITNPELPAVTDALKTIKVAAEFGKPVLGVVVNRYSKDSELDVEVISQMLEVPIIAVIPEHKDMKKAAKEKMAIVNMDASHEVSRGYHKIGAFIAGEKYEEVDLGLIDRILKAIGIR